MSLNAFVAAIAPKSKGSSTIGIKKSVHLPWRFYIKNNFYVSKG